MTVVLQPLYLLRKWSRQDGNTSQFILMYIKKDYKDSSVCNWNTREVHKFDDSFEFKFTGLSQPFSDAGTSSTEAVRSTSTT